MKAKRFIKLINNEKANHKISSAKACDASTISDICGIDHAVCVVHSKDVCYKEDWSGCSNGIDDICDIDYQGCYENNDDYCNIDSCKEDYCMEDMA